MEVDQDLLNLVEPCGRVLAHIMLCNLVPEVFRDLALDAAGLNETKPGVHVRPAFLWLLPIEDRRVRPGGVNGLEVEGFQIE